MACTSPYGAYPVGAVEAVQRGQRAAGGDFEDRTKAVGSAGFGCPVEVPSVALDQRPVRVVAVSAVETVQRCECAAGGDFEDRAEPIAVGCRRRDVVP